jgi:hypothetical protein
VRRESYYEALCADCQSNLPVLSKNTRLTFPATKISSLLTHAILFRAKRSSETPTLTVNTVGRSGGSDVPTTNLIKVTNSFIDYESDCVKNGTALTD